MVPSIKLSLSMSRPDHFVMCTHRIVKECAKKWEMKDVMWMFQDHPDQDADVTMMLELRDEVSEMVKGVEKILVVGGTHSRPDLADMCLKLKEAVHNGKASPLSPLTSCTCTVLLTVVL